MGGASKRNGLQMLALLNVLSFKSGAVVVAIISAFASMAWASLPSKTLTWTLAIVTPLAIASALYWLPAVLGAESSEYSSWAVIFVAPWYFAGLLASVLVVVLFGRRRRGWSA
jgi:hypothetical protein